MSVFRPTVSAGPSSSGSSSPPIATTAGIAARKVFAPPLFANFGKDAKDLFKKKYEFDNQLIFKTPTLGGSIETSVVASADAPLRGVFKSSVPVTTLGRMNGVFESEFHTVTNRESKTSYKLNNLSRGLSVKLGLTGIQSEVKDDSSFEDGWMSAEAEYLQDSFTANAGVRSDTKKTLVDGALTIGHDNVSVGAKVTLDPASKAAPSDYNFGAQYNGSDFVAAVVSDKKHTVVNLSYYQRLSSVKTRHYNYGAVLSLGLVKPTRSLTFGTDYWIDADTSLRAQAKVESGKSTTVVQTAVEHRLLNPNVLLGVAAEFNVSSTSAPAPGRVGVSLTLGEF